MNNVLEKSFLNKIGRFIARPITSFNFKKSRTSIVLKENNSAAIATIAMPEGLPMEQVKGGAKKKQPTTPWNPDALPTGILEIAPFKESVKEELELGNQSFLLKLGLNKENCSFLSEKKQKDLALDCVKLLQKSGIGAKSLAFSPTGKFWVLLANKSEQSAITTANVAFKLVQKLLRAELDAHQSLLDLNMYKIQDCLPEIA